MDDFCGDIGKVGMWESVGYKKHPTDCCGGFCFDFTEISCVFGELFKILFKSHSLQKLAFTSLDFDLEINNLDSYHNLRDFIQ